MQFFHFLDKILLFYKFEYHLLRFLNIPFLPLQ